MATRIILLEVPDVRAEDLLKMAIVKWNEDVGPGDRIRHRVVYSAPVGDRKDIS